MERIEIIAFTMRGCALASRIASGLRAHGVAHVASCGPARFAEELGINAYESLDAWTAKAFEEAQALVFVGASGIAVRAIAPYVRDKFSDPAVVSVDEAGSFCVPLLSGHVGGANDLARTLAQIVGGQAAISTATDVNGRFAVDEWASRHGLRVVERDIAKLISVRILEGGVIGFVSDFNIELRQELPDGVIEGCSDLGFVVSLDDRAAFHATTLHLVPQIVTVGIGCRKGVDASVLAESIDTALDEAHVSPLSVCALATIDVKRGERSIDALSAERDWPVRYYTAEELAAVPGRFSESEFVKRAVGVGNVCERAAMARGGELIGRKRSGNGVTVALARAEWKAGL